MPLGALYEPVEYPYKFNNFTKFDDVNPSRNALQWFLYECQNVECDKDILGINNGTAREGLLGSIPASYPINVVFHPDPFNNIDETQNMEVAFWMLNNETSINKNIYDRVVRIGDADIDVVKGGGLDALPDAAFDIQKLNNESLEFDVKINDVRDL